jgi:hypothetical protein
MNFLHFAGNGSGGTYFYAKGTANAFLRNNAESSKSLTVAGGAALIIDMRFILITEITQGGQYRVGSSLSETA